MSVRAVDSPYKGLAPFDDSDLDALLFFGRERERDVIVANVLAARLTVLYGETGVGKSSILRAAVVRELRRLAPDADVRVLSSWAEHRPIEVGDEETYLVFDQFEEYFVYHPRGGPLLDELPELLQRPRVNVLISLREDALAQLDAFKGRVRNLFGNYLRLEHLDRDAARAAILGPVDRYNELTGENVRVEPALVEAVLDQVASGRVELGPSGRGTASDSRADRIEAPYLQLVLERLWEAEREAGPSVVRADTLHRLGGAAAIVGDHLGHAMDELSETQKETAAAMYNHLVTPSGTKIAHRVGDLAGYARVAEPEAAAVLEKLAQERILRSSSEDGPAAARYEIYHDVLADAVLEWRARHQSERAVGEAERRRRRAFAVATAALVALVIVAAIAVFALVERGREQRQARNAHAQELAANALTKLDTDPRESVRLALSAAILQPKPHEEEVLRVALTRDRERAVLRGGGPIRVASFDPAGRRVLAAGDDGKARLYDRSGRLLAILEHGTGIAAAVFAPRRGLVATGGSDGEVKVWLPPSRHPVATLNAGGGAVRAVAFDKNAARLYAVTAHGVIRGWSVGGHFARIADRRTPIRALGATLAPSGHFVVVIAHDRFARVYALPSGRFVQRLAQKGYIGNAAFSPNERLLLTSGHEGTVRLWRVGSWRLVRELRGPGSVTEALFSGDGRLVAAASADNTARVWETATGFQLAVMIGHTNEVTSVAFNPDASALVTASSDGTARVWASGGRPTSVLAGHGTTVFDATFSPDGNAVVTAGADGTARLWDPGSEPDLQTVTSRRVVDVAVSGDGRRLVTAGAGLTLWGVSPLHPIRRLTTTPTTLAAISPDGARVAASIARGDVVGVFDTRTGSELGRFRTPRAATALAFTAAGRLVAAAGDSVSIWNANRLRAVHEVTNVDDIAVNPDGTLLATAGEDGNVRLRDAGTWALRRTLRGHRAAVNSVEFSADGKQLVTSSQDEDVRLWNIATGRPQRILHWHSGPVADAAISPDGRWIATAGPITAGIGLASSEELFRPGAYLRGPTQPLTGVAFGGRDGHLVIATSKDGRLRAFRCDVCGDVHALIALAHRRLAR